MFWPLVNEDNKALLKYNHYLVVEKVFTDIEIDKLIELVYKNKDDIHSAAVGESENKVQNNSIRDSKIKWLRAVDETYEFYFRRITDVVHYVNTEFTQFNITHLSDLQYTEYDESYKGFYNRHPDDSIYPGNDAKRKLSISILLTDPNEYEGGGFVLWDDRNIEIPIKYNKGDALIFASVIPHAVQQVTKGKRRSLVTWASGPDWR